MCGICRLCTILIVVLGDVCWFSAVVGASGCGCCVGIGFNCRRVVGLVALFFDDFEDVEQDGASSLVLQGKDVFVDVRG